jgi:glycerol-3-phosphate O-acyltransferase
MRTIHFLPGTETPAPPTIRPEVEAQQAAMATEFNRLHHLIFPRFFKKIQVDDRSFDALAQIPKDAAVVTVTPLIGQLSYNYFNYLYIQRSIPLPQLVNDLSLTLWRPWGDIKRMARLYLTKDNRSTLPLWQSLIEDGIPTLIRLKTSRFHDDLYWERIDDDPLVAVIQAAQASTRPIYCVPQDFIWNKHPDKPTNAFTLFLLGDRDSRGPLRKLFFFLLYYKRRAVVRCGTPLQIQDWLATQPANTPLPILVKSLRAELLTQLRIERTAITGPSIKPRAWIIEQALQSEPVQRCIYELAQDRSKPVAQIQDLARRYADEIAADPHYSMIEIAARVIHWALTTLYDGITIDDDSLQHLKRAIGQGPVILVPNHRSHMDYLLISTMLYSRNVALPFIAGGINMNFWPMGPIFRHCGAYFLRRSFGGNPLYKAVFQAYLTELVRQGYCQEFFIEGTRSRTGKMAHPKLGMASMLVESWREGASPDITFVPVSLTYDQVMEVKSYTSELKGAGKAAERARDILKLGRFFKRRWGHVYLRFGEPISLGLTAAELWTDPNPAHITPQLKPQLVQHLVRSILYAINKQAVVTPAALVAMVLLSQDKPCSLEDITRRSRLLMDYLQWKGATCAPGLTTMTEVHIQETLHRLTAQKIVAIENKTEPTVFSITPGHRNTLDYTKNTGIHFFVSIACVARLVRAHGGTAAAAPFDPIHSSYNALKQLFMFEFNFSTRKTIAEHLHTLLDYLQSAQLTDDDLAFTSSLLDNYIEAYRTLFQFFSTTPPADGPERQWIKSLIQFGRQLRERKELRHDESVSKSIFQNGLMLMEELGVCTHTAAGQLHWNGTNDRFDELQQLITSFST